MDYAYFIPTKSVIPAMMKKIRVLVLCLLFGSLLISNVLIHGNFIIAFLSKAIFEQVFLFGIIILLIICNIAKNR